jgi:SPW repeat
MTKYPQDWVNYFLGLWVLGSPWFIEHRMDQYGTGRRDTRDVKSVGGRAAVVVLTTLAINGIMTAWDQRTIFALGAWLRLSPWIIGFSATVPLMWNSVIFGGLIFVFAGWRRVDDRPRRTAES